MKANKKASGKENAHTYTYSYLTDRLARWPAIEQACLYLWPMTERKARHISISLSQRRCWTSICAVFLFRRRKRILFEPRWISLLAQVSECRE